MQFFKVKESNLNSDLKGGNEILIYSLLEDRMQASTKNKDFFSKKFNDYYVIYTRDELATKLGVNVSTITEVFKRLVKKGYLVMKHQFNGASKLFLPKFENETNPEANHHGSISSRQPTINWIFTNKEILKKLDKSRKGNHKDQVP